MNKQVALVLGSGGARGYAHIGVIEELERRGYHISCISGCSIGSIIGGVYAAGQLPAYREWVESLDYLDVLRLLDISFRLGAIRGERIFNKLHEMLGDIDIQDLPIPYTAVATDLTNQQEIWFQEGDLHQAMRASAAIPSLFTPVIQGSRVLVDGGLLNPLPIIPVASGRSDLIIAVNLNSLTQRHYALPVIERSPSLKIHFDTMLGAFTQHLPFLRRLPEDTVENEEATLETEILEPKHAVSVSPDNATLLDINGPGNLLEVINQSLEVMQSSLAQYKIAGYPPDILISIPKRVCRFFEFYKAPELIELGRQIASETLDRYEQENE